MNVLQEADQLINGDRQEDYGPPEIDYRKTVEAFNALTGHALSVADGLLFMVCVKLSRETWKHKRDNITDGIGYLACIQRVHDKTAERIAADEGG